jgi:hypothetical protein
MVEGPTPGSTSTKPIRPTALRLVGETLEGLIRRNRLTDVLLLAAADGSIELMPDPCLCAAELVALVGVHAVLARPDPKEVTPSLLYTFARHASAGRSWRPSRGC